ncbi:hypothetical protein QA648_34240 (plasmid) [Rhizobium sp. CB3171]|uniref:hypothetical protein n=1 Tax=Rhizobium sp. CB3171 TaxID=3039157 RepID=UPI0024B196CD|nr:hypothetical protein [Rhizobium sp. CB3171]WFU06838.1 hypothetical protein QA648_34240 [Rhizobium sp. CB3171]
MHATALGCIDQLAICRLRSRMPAGFNGRVRDEIQTDILGRRVASILDPVGHIWALV